MACLADDLQLRQVLGKRTNSIQNLLCFIPHCGYSSGHTTVEIQQRTYNRGDESLKHLHTVISYHSWCRHLYIYSSTTSASYSKHATHSIQFPHCIASDLTCCQCTATHYHYMNMCSCISQQVLYQSCSHILTLSTQLRGIFRLASSKHFPLSSGS